MRMTQRQKGSVSVFLAIILLTTFLFSGVVIDGGRIYAGRTIVSGAGQLALNAGLSNYDTALKDAYGLIAMSKTPEEMNDNLHTYFVDSLGACGLTEDDFNTALVFLQEAAEDEGSFSATHLDKTEICRGQVMEQQALEYMKYRAPITLTKKGIIDHLAQVDMKEIQQTKKVAEDQTDTAKAANDMQKKLEKLWKAVQKEYKNYNAFADFDERLQQAEDYYAAATVECLINRYVSSIPATSGDEETLMGQFSGYIQSIKTNIDSATTPKERKDGYINAADAIYGAQAIYMYLKDLTEDEFIEKYCEAEDTDTSEDDSESEEDDALKQYYKDMYQTYKDEEQYFTDKVNGLIGLRDADEKEGNKIIEDLSKKSEDYAKQDQKVLNCINKLRDSQKKLKEKYDTWGEDIQGLKKNKDEMEENRKPYADFVDEDSDLKDMEKLIQKNKDFYEEFHKRIESNDCVYETTRLSVLWKSGVNNVLTSHANENTNALKATMEKFTSYIYIVNIREADFSANELFDNVSETEFYKKLEKYCNTDSTEADKNSAEIKQQFQNYLIELKNLFTSEDLKDIQDNIKKNESKLPTTLMSSTSSENVTATDETITENCDLNDSDSRDKTMDSAKNAMNADNTLLNSMGTLAEKLDSTGEAVVEPFYLTEYMTDMFSCYTSDKSGEKENNKWKKKDEVKSLSGYDMTQDVIYRAEAEYILWGNKNNARTNVNATKAVIFAIQLVGNLLYAFTEKNLQEQVNTIASCFPSAIVQVVVRTVLPIILALVQTVRDLVILVNGGKVVLFKSFPSPHEEDWRTSPLDLAGWDMTKDESSKDEALALSYEEYVWIMLCIKNINENSRYKQLERAADCIQMNIQKDESDFEMVKKYTMLQVKANVKMDNWLVTDIFNGEGTLDTSGEYTLKYLGVQGY